MVRELSLVDALERIAFGAVALTTSALAEVKPTMDLTLHQWRALAVLGDREPPRRVGELAVAIGADGPSTSRTLRRLEREGLVTAERDERDRRATLVRLTRPGRRLRNEVMRRRRQLIKDVLVPKGDPLPGDLLAGLNAIAARVENRTPRSSPRPNLATRPGRRLHRITQDNFPR